MSCLRSKLADVILEWSRRKLYGVKKISILQIEAKLFVVRIRTCIEIKDEVVRLS